MRLLAADPATAQHDLLAGDYDGVIKTATAALKEPAAGSDWALLLVQAELDVGRNADADRAMRDALERDPSSIRLRWLARDVAQANGRPEEAAQRTQEIGGLLRQRFGVYRAPPDLVVIGRAALELGADPKDVLDKIFALAQKADPKLRDVYLARGELALSKHDFALAAKAFDEGLKQLPDDPDLLCGRARAFASGDREEALKTLKSALEKNPRHVPSLLQLVDFHVDAEAYDDAAKTIEQILAVNPHQPEAWAYRAVLAHLRNDAAGENAAHDQALAGAPRNPRVDFLIGQKLAQKYRFAEAAAYERRARALDASYLPASAELAQDLLRLGDEAEGWSLAQAVHERDDYDVEAYNLVTLHDTMAKYASLTSDDFVLRMSPQEVSIFGSRVLGLLRRAKQTFTAKYGVELANPTYVEIFADQRDFAVRTFGLPDIPGFLGVCFGRVVTANSPSTSTSPTNWESVVWHEFCHVVTLQFTKNKMPRWLSEGISVYEERQADPAWGMRLSPSYREMIANGELTPVGKLSGAFLAPKTPQHLQFAYLESAMVVEFIVDRFGLPALRGVLANLRDGAEINAALAKNTEPLEQLEKDFDRYAHAQADALAPKLDWEKPDRALLRPGAEDELAAWEKQHPDNDYMLRLRAGQAVEDQNWAKARAPLQRLVELYPRQKGPETAYRPLVTALHALGDAAAERRALNAWAAVDDEAPEAYLRLMELAAAEQDWPTVKQNVERYLAVNPLVAPPYRYLAQASAATHDASDAVVAWRTLLQLDPPDPSGAHYQLATLLHQRGEDGEAKRHVLLALEEAPRFREALHLLLELEGRADSAAPAPVMTPAVAPPKISAQP
ncbi:MAG TPA: tetratricopeptide repeat protein [Opitutaceae bacterium]|nr:tetratricopeptide repeat protein [Opitutaceae bacterium]